MSPIQSQKRARVIASNSSSSLTHLIVDQERANKPIGIRLFGTCFRFKSQASKRRYHQALVLLLTFIAYTAFHMSRRPLSVVKNVLNRDCSRLKPKNVTDNFEATATTILISQGNQHPDFLQSHQRHSENVIIPDTQRTPGAQPSTSYNNYDYDESPTYSTTISPSHVLDNQLANQLILSNTTDQQAETFTIAPTKDTSCDWAPFNDDATANKLLAALDTSFLLSYAVFMFVSGFVAERTNLRYFISLGSLVSGLGLIAFGLSKDFDIHSMTYFIMVQIISGVAQTTGWPVVVTCVSNWFDRSKLGTIYGLWNSHTNLGNILGATIAGYYVESDWGLSFIVPGIIIIMVGLILFLFLVPSPHDIGLLPTKTEAQEVINNNDDESAHRHAVEPAGSVEVRARARDGSGALSSSEAAATAAQDDLKDRANIGAENQICSNESLSTAVNKQSQHVQSGPTTLASSTLASDYELGEHLGSLQTNYEPSSECKQHQSDINKPISFMKALRIPGVIEYSFCLFFSKLVSYTFLYWLPRYITSSTSFNSKDSAYLSTPFDVGGIFGSIMAGWLSDRFKVNGIICNIMLILAIPSMFIYQQFGAISSWHNIMLQLLVGSLVNGPYCLITTAVSADLGNRIKNSHAMATVSAIIDGMGSVGAVLGPLFAGFVSTNDWRSVFLMLMMADVLASLCIIRVTIQDVRVKLAGGDKSRSSVQA